MRRQNAAQSFSRIFTRTRFLAGQKESRLMDPAITRETALGRSVELSVISGVVSRRQVVKHARAVIEGCSSDTRAALSDIPHFSEEGSLLPEINSLLVR